MIRKLDSKSKTKQLCGYSLCGGDKKMWTQRRTAKEKEMGMPVCTNVYVCVYLCT